MKNLTHHKKDPSSFRDPSGFVFSIENQIFRQINKCYKENYNWLIDSGLYETLVKKDFLVPHKEVTMDFPQPEVGYKIIKPEEIAFVSYPYEWCFSQLKNAALTKLKIQRIALEHGMTLKDASAYNIQFQHGSPVLIDTLSFEKYQEGAPWVAYRQFCQHFLAPLSLMSFKDIRLNQLLRIYIDGIPLDLASELLPLKTRFKYSLLTHIHLHAKTQRHYADQTQKKHTPKLSRLGFEGIINSLECAVNSLKWEQTGTEWSDYYSDTNYTSEGFEHKRQILQNFLHQSNPRTVWDIGANNGYYSRLASDAGIHTVAFDVDPVAVENNYLRVMSQHEKNILPLLSDLTNPSPGLGWQNQERASFKERGPVDTVLALALIHHFAITNNLPFLNLAEFLQTICRWLIIEFVPKNDSQVERLLATRKDVFNAYSQDEFERNFEKFFKIKEKIQINTSKRIMYLMCKL